MPFPTMAYGHSYSTHTSVHGCHRDNAWFCASCVFKNTTTFDVLGWCKESLLEPSRRFTLYQDSLGNITFLGEKDSKIVWNREAALWNLTMISKPIIFATTNATFDTFLMGTHTWKVE